MKAVLQHRRILIDDDEMNCLDTTSIGAPRSQVAAGKLPCWFRTESHVKQAMQGENDEYIVHCEGVSNSADTAKKHSRYNQARRFLSAVLSFES